jgi:hypothetical protein
MPLFAIDKEDLYCQVIPEPALSPPADTEWINDRARKLADLAYAKWVSAGRQPGAWKLCWYEARIEIEV